MSSAVDRLWEGLEPQRIRLKDRPDLGEEWIKDKLAADPSMLQLGALTLEDRERQQPGAGRLDLLFRDFKFSKAYEVEVQLGRLNASHVLRAIEYWEVERAHYPNEDHCVVLIAEDVTGSRFLSAVRILAEYIPLIVLEARALQLNDKVTLELTKISLTRSFVPVEEEQVKVTPPGSAERLVLEIVDTFAPGVSINRTKSYLGLRKNPGGKYFAVLRSRSTGVQLDLLLERSSRLEEELEEEGLTLRWTHRRRRDSYRVTLTEEELQDNYVLIRRLLLESYEKV